MTQVTIFSAVLEKKLEDYINEFIEKMEKGENFEIRDIQFLSNRHGELTAIIIYKI